MSDGGRLAQTAPMQGEAREAARRETEAHVRLILDGALDAVVSTDAADVITYWNPQAEKTFGWTADEALGQRFGELILPPEPRQDHDRDMERFLATGEAPSMNRRTEVEGKRQDGTRLPLELAISVVKVWDACTFNVFARDITERRRADEERRQLLEKAQEVGRTKDEFLALLSHELRTPLSAIVGWAHMLRTSELDEATRARAIETIDRNAKLQNQLIEDILDVSRIVAGKFHVEMRSVDLVKVIEAARDTVAPLAATRKVDLHLDVEATTPLTIGDPDRLQQVAWNLLSNAIKFTPAGGKVSIELSRRDESFELTVRDSGAGIDPAFLPHIFERFRQGGDSGAKRHGGLGLGLSIVRHIVEMHDGTVEARSEGRDQGSTFVVRLPAVDTSTEKVPPGGRDGRGSAAGRPARPRRRRRGRCPQPHRGRPPGTRGPGLHGRLRRGSGDDAAGGAPGRRAQRHLDARRGRVRPHPQGPGPAPGERRADAGGGADRLRAAGGPDEGPIRGVPAPRGQARGPRRAGGRGGDAGRPHLIPAG